MDNSKKIFLLEKKLANRILRENIFYIKKENEFFKEFQKDRKTFIFSKLKEIGVVITPFLMSIVKEDVKIKKEFKNFIFLVARNAYLRYNYIIDEIFSQISNETALLREDVEADIEKILETPFFGKTFDDRLQENFLGNIQEIEKKFKEGMTKGLGYYTIAREIQKVVAFYSINIERMVRTEGQRIQNTILARTYEKNKKNLGGIMYLATLDPRTCETCGHYDRNEFFYERKPSVMTAPYVPMHPMCRCVYVPFTKQITSEERASMGGYTKEKYSDWLWNAEKDDPGFAKDILGSKYGEWLDGKYELQPLFTPQLTYMSYMIGK